MSLVILLLLIVAGVGTYFYTSKVEKTDASASTPVAPVSKPTETNTNKN